jgi:DNA-directed RNA polymerase specialized sigma24 family protein
MARDDDSPSTRVPPASEGPAEHEDPALETDDADAPAQPMSTVAELSLSAATAWAGAQRERAGRAEEFRKAVAAALGELPQRVTTTLHLPESLQPATLAQWIRGRVAKARPELVVGRSPRKRWRWLRHLARSHVRIHRHAADVYGRALEAAKHANLPHGLDPEDLASSTYLKASTSPPENLSRATLASWVQTTAANCRTDHFRKEGAKREARSEQRDDDDGFDAVADAVEPASSECDVSRALEHGEVMAKFRGAIRALLPEHQQAVALRIAGLSDCEIALRMDKPQGTVRCWFSREIPKRLRAIVSIDAEDLASAFA